MALQLAEDFAAVLAGLEGRGRGFERLVAWWLRHDPEWAPRVARVWTWLDWPERWGPDRGIDLICELRSGGWLAVQAKHYGAAHTIIKSDVDSFLSESNRPPITERLLVATTQKVAASARQVIDAQDKPVTMCLRDRLEDSPVKWRAFAPPQVAVPPPAIPRPHQLRAVDDVIDGLSRADRGQLIMPCGTGKTLTSLWISERLEANTTLVVVPTLVLLRQTALAWAHNASGAFDALRVCSDSAGDDELADISRSEVGPRTTTRPQEIAEFLSGDGRRIIFCTYDSTPRIAQALTRLPGRRLDLIVCDEAHHCAGVEDSKHRTVLSDERVPAAKRLFVTATPVVFAPAVQQAARRVEARLASMKDHRLFGFVLHRLTFRSAVEQRLLCPYQVVVMPITDDDVAQLISRRRIVTPDGEHVTDAYSLAAQIACLRAMARYGCRHMVVFCDSVEHSRRFALEVELAAPLLSADERPEGVRATHVDGYMPRPKRDRLLDCFQSEPRPQLLSNVRLLAEGVDIDSIDAICLIDPHRRTAAVVQAVGRAVRLAPGKDIGTILLPVLVREGQSVDDALQASEHRPVLELLAALRSLDIDIVTTIENVRLELGPARGRRDRAPRFAVDAPTEVGEEFAEAVEVALVDVLAAGRRRRDLNASTTGPRRPQIGEITYPEDLDWSDPAVFQRGLETAKRCVAGGRFVIRSDLRHGGFPVGAWLDATLARWETGKLTKDDKQSLCEVVNWLCVNPGRFPTARRQLARTDTVSVADRLDSWLGRWGDAGTRPRDIDDLVRLGAIGADGRLSTHAVVAVLDEDQPKQSLVNQALALLRAGGETIVNCRFDGQDVSANGFHEALKEPGRSSGSRSRTIRAPPDCRATSLRGGWRRRRRCANKASSAAGATTAKSARQSGRPNGRDRRGAAGRIPASRPAAALACSAASARHTRPRRRRQAPTRP